MPWESKAFKALSSVPPFYFKFSEDEIVNYYTDLAKELGGTAYSVQFPEIDRYLAYS